MNKSLFVFISLLAITVAPINVIAQSLPITVGMNYGVARQRLIQAGWQPLVPSFSDIKWNTWSEVDRDIQKRLAGAFRRRGWYETLFCTPTGIGSCEHQFFDVNGRGLIVETGSGGYGPVPNVRKFYYKDGTR